MITEQDVFMHLGFIEQLVFNELKAKQNSAFVHRSATHYEWLHRMLDECYPIEKVPSVWTPVLERMNKIDGAFYG